MSQKEFVKPVGLETPYRLFNLGGTAFVESKQGDDLDIMPASWNCPLDYDKMTVVIDSTHYSRKLIEASEYILLAGDGNSERNSLFRFRKQERQSQQDCRQRSEILHAS